MIGFELAPGQPQVGPPLPLAAFFANSGGRAVALAVAPRDGLSVWTEIAPNVAACLNFENDDTATRLSWRETLVMELRNIYPIGDLVLTGIWSQAQSSGSGLSNSYTGNRAATTTSTMAKASVTVDRTAPYDLWVHYTGRTSGSYCRVDIDGAQTLVNEIEDPAGLGFKAFSTHSATDLCRRMSIKVASGLTGSHNITLRNGGASNPGGSTLMIEAVAISGALGDDRILPPQWQAGQLYTIGDEVQRDGVFYAARATGTSGAVTPAHTAGIASDGALEWRADSRSTYPKFICIDYPSEREYAARCVIDGVTTEVGGQTHGNELLQSRTIALDGSAWVPVSGTGLQVGTHVAINETTVWQTGAQVPFADCQLSRQITPGRIAHDVTVSGTGPLAEIAWLYVGMVPMVRWDGESRSTVVDTVAVEAAVPVSLASYAGQAAPSQNYPAARRIGLSATFEGGGLRYGILAGAIPVIGNLVNQFDTFVLPNIDATSESGSLDWKAKAYIAGNAAGGLAFGAGDVMGFYSRHVFGTV